MAYKAPEQRPGESPAAWAQRVLSDTSHHVVIDESNIHEWLLLEQYRNKPWKLMTPRGTFDSDRLHERWVVPHIDGHPDDVFRLRKIIWHSDEDGWVAEYT